MFFINRYKQRKYDFLRKNNLSIVPRCVYLGLKFAKIADFRIRKYILMIRTVFKTAAEKSRFPFLFWFF